MKTRVCPECGQWNGHHMGCPEMPEPIEFDDEVEDEALDELLQKERENAMWWPKPHFASCAEQEDFDE